MAPSLIIPPTNYFLTATGGTGGSIANSTGNATQASVCVGMAPTDTNPSISGTFNGHLIHTGMSYFNPGSTFTFAMELRQAGDPASAPVAGGGYSINAVIRHGNSTYTSDGAFVQAAGTTGNQQGSIGFTIPPIDNVSASDQPLSLVVTIAKTDAGGAQFAANVGLLCNVEGTAWQGVEFVRGAIGEGDIDGDGAPDSEDSDRDGDGVANAAEALTCDLGTDGGNVSFADRPDLMPGGDSDGDGFTDDDECAAGASPLSSISTPPQPAQIPWALIIGVFVALALIGGIAFVFIKFGTIITVTMASAGEVIVEPGKTAKYQVGLQNTRAEGDAVTFQVVVEGTPEGWDATMDVDHVSLEAGGGAGSHKDVYLTVEAPDHEDPESAAVTVKVVPLNKQGKKDTLKLAGKAKTITSINIPEDAKVPVKKGGPVKIKSPKEKEGSAPKAPPIPPEGLPVGELPGVTPAMATKLGAADAGTTEALRTADLDALATATKIKKDSLAHWQRVSDLIRVPGLNVEHAEALVSAGVESTSSLGSMGPEEIVERFNKQVAAEGA